MRLRELRDEKGVTQQVVGDALGITQQAVYNYENGVTEPDIDMLKAIANYFDVSIDYLVGHSNIRFSTTELESYKLNEQEASFIDSIRGFNDDYRKVLLELLRKTKSK